MLEPEAKEKISHTDSVFIFKLTMGLMNYFSKSLIFYKNVALKYLIWLLKGFTVSEAFASLAST